MTTQHHTAPLFWLYFTTNTNTLSLVAAIQHERIHLEAVSRHAVLGPSSNNQRLHILGQTTPHTTISVHAAGEYNPAAVARFSCISLTQEWLDFMVVPSFPVLN